ncbi:hypothetical protein [Spiroplasma endosymbiont of Virgichneumon dumeticola]|uniref:hypothetical protein n=1 Tax=Spiroplasma endosymbiont of Virgichneumon dumeticola TaxID=3139323 RepID=UPI0035C8DB87
MSNKIAITVSQSDALSLFQKGWSAKILRIPKIIPIKPEPKLIKSILRIFLLNFKKYTLFSKVATTFLKDIINCFNFIEKEVMEQFLLSRRIYN